MDTINKLLKKQAPKRRGKISVMEPGATATAGGDDATPGSQEAVEQFEKPKATYVRWISNRQGSRVGVPEEWLGTPVGRVFGGAAKEISAGM